MFLVQVMGATAQLGEIFAESWCVWTQCKYSSYQHLCQREEPGKKNKKNTYNAAERNNSDIDIIMSLVNTFFPNKKNLKVIFVISGVQVH